MSILVELTADKGSHMGIIKLEYTTEQRSYEIGWNVRGAGRIGFGSHVRYLIFKYNPDIIAFMETKVNSNKTDKIIGKINLPNFLEIPDRKSVV